MGFIRLAVAVPATLNTIRNYEISLATGADKR